MNYKSYLLVGLLSFTAGFFTYRYLSTQPYAPLELKETGKFVCFARNTIEIGAHVHYGGKMYVVTKLVLQHPGAWVEKNRAYYTSRPGPRFEHDGMVSIETIHPYDLEDEPILVEVFGVPVDGWL